MPAKRKTKQTNDKDNQRAAQRAWMIEQKRNLSEVEEEHEDEKNDQKDSEADSGVEDNIETVSNTDEEDGPLEDWTVKVLRKEIKIISLVISNYADSIDSYKTYLFCSKITIRNFFYPFNVQNYFLKIYI